MTTNRWTYNKEHDSDLRFVPELVMLGSDEVRKALPLTEHQHPGCYEFVFIERGKAGWALGEEHYETTAGQVFHSRPGEKHRGSFNVIEPCKFWWLIVEEPAPIGWLGFTTEELMHIQHALAELPRVKHVGWASFEALKRLKHTLLFRNALQSVAVRAALIKAILAIIAPHSGSHEIAADLKLRFEELIERMGKEPEWRPTVNELAQMTGVSSSHFYRTFQSYTGEPPITFAERLRVKEACRQLEGSQDSITDIAYRLGYPSSQHFATVFKRFIGATPSQWRRTR
ncbi:AraC family transcriptional regulator [Paenibacillus sp. PL2-23]|uniref:helix-turn-helix domain-containing protein n=1 Tax=Paenibacillus sp. PL2-23 TaxID=2100729 RepID=UPI0030F9353E